MLLFQKTAPPKEHKKFGGGHGATCSLHLKPAGRQKTKTGHGQAPMPTAWGGAFWFFSGPALPEPHQGQTCSTPPTHTHTGAGEWHSAPPTHPEDADASPAHPALLSSEHNACAEPASHGEGVSELQKMCALFASTMPGKGWAEGRGARCLPADTEIAVTICWGKVTDGRDAWPDLHGNLHKSHHALSGCRNAHALASICEK